VQAGKCGVQSFSVCRGMQVNSTVAGGGRAGTADVPGGPRHRRRRPVPRGPGSLMQHGRQKAVVGAAKHDAINTAFQQRFEAPADIAGQRRIVELEHLDMGRPAGTGFDMDLDVGGMVADQLVQAGALRRAFRCQYGDASALGFCAAGLMPGSTPTTGMPGCAARKDSTAAAVAVLQATTSRWQPMPAKHRQSSARGAGSRLRSCCRRGRGRYRRSSGSPIAARPRPGRPIPTGRRGRNRRRRS
jgi:hypothetical protein